MKHSMLLTHGLVALVCAVLGIGFCYQTFFLSSREAAVCDREESKVPNGSQSIIVVNGECNGFPSASSTLLSLKDARGRVSAPFLVYYRSGPGPLVSWTGPNMLSIDISNPDDIKYARDEMDGTRIQYRLHWSYNQRAQQ